MEIEIIPIGELIEDPSNVNKHPDKNISALKGSLGKFGQQKPIVINKDNIIIAGNGTYQAAKALKWEELQCVRSELGNVDQIAYAIADNRTSELSEWDDIALKEQLKALDEADFDVSVIGFDDFSFEEENKPLTPEEAKEVEGDTIMSAEMEVDKEFLLIVFDDKEQLKRVNEKLQNEYKVGYWLTKHKRNPKFFREGPNRVIRGEDFLTAITAFGVKDDWIAYCPSWKRADTAFTHKLFSKDRFVYVVREEEAEAYEKIGYPIKVIPKGTVENLAQTLNWILDNSEYRNIVRLDDDISKIQALPFRQRQYLTPEQIEIETEKMFDITYNFGISLWGINLLDDPLSYSINKPFSFQTPILGPWSGHIIDDIRYDEKLFLKEDYDYYLQKVSRYGFCVRNNYLSYVCDHMKMKGGCQEYRTMEEERKQQAMLQEKWGSKIIRYNEVNPDSINMKVRL